MEIFNEQKLRAEIVKTWGEFGAHIEVYDMLLRKANVVLPQANVSGMLDSGKPQMNIASLRTKIKEFFNTVTPAELIKEFELLGYEFKPIDGKSNDN